MSIVKSLRLIADPTRIRILSLLAQHELSVAELQQILSMGQSRISSQLSQLKQAGLVADRRLGKHILYALREPRQATHRQLQDQLMSVVALGASELEEIEIDNAALKLALDKRQNRAREYFDQLAGKFGRAYCPGRSWKGLAEILLKLMPAQVIADLGAGEGTFSQLLAQRAERVIAIDSSEKMVEFGSRLAQEHGYANLEYRLGDLEDPPIEDGSVDLAFFSQALHHANRPGRAIRSAHRITRPGGRIVILDLLKHDFEDARDLYADVWLGFSEVEVLEHLKDAGFINIDIAVVDKETEPPHFQTLMAIAEKSDE